MRKTILAITKEIFYFLTVSIAVFVLLEIIWPGIVLAYININWVLISWAVIGIIILLINNKNK